MIAELREKAEQARESARPLSTLETRTKNQALKRISELLRDDGEAVLEANRQDLGATRASRLSHKILDRLLLTPERPEGIAHDVEAVAALPDPVGESFDATVLPNGLQVAKRRVPLGVIGVIYESRPNVTVDISALCLKSGKEARHTNRALAELLVRAVSRSGIPTGSIQLIDSTDRKLVLQMLRDRPYIDMIISPRRGRAARIGSGTRHHTRHHGWDRHLPRLRGSSRRPLQGGAHRFQCQGATAHRLQRLGHAPHPLSDRCQSAASDCLRVVLRGGGTPLRSPVPGYARLGKKITTPSVYRWS